MSYRVSTPDGTTFAFDTQAEADAREAEIRRGSDRAQVVTWRDGYESEQQALVILGQVLSASAGGGA